ncbi:hypothetical protein GCM10010981_29450 [Dyella nitratireducens]|uniref:Uncharacterized protein n=1 Tax=Dyella nitratireducens TaxID=1849580 RepID=A0ABQ1G7N0_9GAMM|nr:hypothetical protein GCM10010981_29450 [Dyella nitratireducens]GLQ40302.1 hypothetical protein GCM10007902_01510 [Dyella nitratireducens]
MEGCDKPVLAQVSGVSLFAIEACMEIIECRALPVPRRHDATSDDGEKIPECSLCT